MGGRGGAFGGTGGAFGGTGGGRGGAFGGTGGGGGLSSGSLRAAVDLAGQVTIIADPDTNSLLVRTSPKNYDRVKVILEELDRAVAQVLIKVLIAEVTHDKGSDIGTEFSVLNLRASGLGQKVGTDFGLAKPSPGLVVQILEQDFTATIRALETAGKLDVLSRPYILASDNQLASILIGQEVPFITYSQLTDTGQINNTIQYTSIGIMLDVIPHINPDGLVILDVAPEISSLLKDTSVKISPDVSAPIFATRNAQTRVAIRDGQTVVIGGLMEDRKAETVEKVPLLGDIPLLGELFKRKREQKTKTELLIFLTPHVAARPELLKDMSQREMEGSKLVPSAVDKNAFQDHMRNMGRRADEPPANRDGKE
jgi:general secretion pathway protein D